MPRNKVNDLEFSTNHTIKSQIRQYSLQHYSPYFPTPSIHDDGPEDFDTFNPLEEILNFLPRIEDDYSENPLTWIK